MKTNRSSSPTRPLLLFYPVHNPTLGWSETLGALGSQVDTGTHDLVEKLRRVFAPQGLTRRARQLGDHVLGQFCRVLRCSMCRTMLLVVCIRARGYLSLSFRSFVRRIYRRRNIACAIFTFLISARYVKILFQIRHRESTQRSFDRPAIGRDSPRRNGRNFCTRRDPRNKRLSSDE